VAAPRVRFAPSPTGYLHVGGARTALFNWLFARRHGGTFVLRIEDTDTERSSAEMVTGILDGMGWLGLDWDEGPGIGGPHEPYVQSQRYDRHRAAAAALVAGGRAYYCYCSAERLREEREMAERRGEAWKYDRRCRALPPEQVAANEAAHLPRAIRFKVPEGKTAFDDVVHGRIEFDGAHIEDFVIVRSDGHPIYHLSVVVDDIDMAITHIVRGDDHISNTPKHALLFRALGAALPVFAHVPLILGADRKRLSKRHGATSVMEYQRQGFLSDALVNFLALLGWSPGADRELMSRRELVDAFTLEGITGSNAVFDVAKLEWMNGQYVARMPIEQLAAAVLPLLVEQHLWAAGTPASEWLLRLLELLRPRAKRLTDFVDQARPFLLETVEYEEEARAKHLAVPRLTDHVRALVQALREVMPFDEQHVEAAVRRTAEQQDIKAAPLIHATRVAVTGRTASPGIFEVLVLLGRDRTVARLEDLASFLSAQN
jgi:glutamyl-tRNA synthetase